MGADGTPHARPLPCAEAHTCRGGGRRSHRRRHVRVAALRLQAAAFGCMRLQPEAADPVTVRDRPCTRKASLPFSAAPVFADGTRIPLSILWSVVVPLRKPILAMRQRQDPTQRGGRWPPNVPPILLAPQSGQ